MIQFYFLIWLLWLICFILHMEIWLHMCVGIRCLVCHVVELWQLILFLVILVAHRWYGHRCATTWNRVLNSCFQLFAHLCVHTHWCATIAALLFYFSPSFWAISRTSHLSLDIFMAIQLPTLLDAFILMVTSLQQIEN